MTSPLGRLVPIIQDLDRSTTILLREAADDAGDRIRRLAGKDGVGAQVRRAQYLQVRAEVLRTTGSLYQEIPASLVYSMDRAGQAAARASEELDNVLFRHMGGIPEELAEAHRAQARQTINQYLARTANGIPLSDQVWRTEMLSNGFIDTQINRALLLGESWKELADRVQESIRPGVRGGVSYAAKRLGRTEINNAFHTAQIDNNRRKPWVDAFRWNLSRSHPKADTCDEYANETHYRGGEPGHYHKEDVPKKPHPQCMCYITAESVSEDEFVNGFLAGRYDRYLDETAGVTRMDVTAPASRRAPAANPTKAAKAKLRRALGGRLHVKQSLSSDKHIHELANEIPKAFQQALGRHEVDVWIGPGSVPDQDHLGYLKGVQPRGWSEGQTWDIVPGAYDPLRKVIAIGDENAHAHGSTSLALHEGGHGIDDAVGRLLVNGGGPASEQARFGFVYRRIMKIEESYMISPYYRQAGEGGRSELWAESFAAWAKYRNGPNVARKVGEGLTKGFSRSSSQMDFDVADLGRPLVKYFEETERMLNAALA